MSKRILLILIFMLLATGTALAQDQLTATTGEGIRLNMRQQPSLSGALITTLPPSTTLVVEGRNEFGDWLLVRTADGALRGWIAIGFVQLSHPVRVIDEISLVQNPAVSVAQRAGAPVVESASDGHDDGFVPETGPVIESTNLPEIYLPGSVMRNVARIFARGRQTDKAVNSLMKVGDSNMAHEVFLCNLQIPGQYDLGEYSHLENVRAMFASTQSFCRNFYSAQPGFSTTSVLDPTFAPDDFCERRESPLECDVRVLRPSFAFIYIGIVDGGIMSTSDYRRNLTQIVDNLSGWGVVPILMTFVTDERLNQSGIPGRYNNVVREVARAEAVPLIDIRASVYDFDNHGASPDGWHLSENEHILTVFTGDEVTYGRPRRDLLALEVLHSILSVVG